MNSVGALIMRERVFKGLTQGDLARLIGKSTAYISNIERGKTDPPVGVLRELATVLECPVANFFPGGNEENNSNTSNGHVNRSEALAKVVKQSSRKRFVDPNIPSTTWELLSPNTRKKMEFLLVRYEPGAHSQEHVGHDGEECGLVLQGRLKVCFEEGEEYFLEEGDSIYFESSHPHAIRNISDGVTITVWVITPPTF